MRLRPDQLRQLQAQGRMVNIEKVIFQTTDQTNDVEEAREEMEETEPIERDVVEVFEIWRRYGS